VLLAGQHVAEMNHAGALRLPNVTTPLLPVGTWLYTGTTSRSEKKRSG
jgi:hypothetical protein